MLRKTMPFSVAPLPAAVRRSLVVSLGGMLCAAPMAALAQEDTINTGTTVVTATALKVDTPEVETPRAISTVSAEELETRGVNKYDETFQYRSGVVSHLTARTTTRIGSSYVASARKVRPTKMACVYSAPAATSGG